jgi:hypothetical protein
MHEITSKKARSLPQITKKLTMCIFLHRCMGLRVDIGALSTCAQLGVVEGRHGFSPFCEVIDCDNDVFVSIVGWGITSHEVDAPFTKGANSNDWVEKSRWCSCFVGIKLTFIASLHGMNAIVKQCRPKITCSDDFLSSGHP